MKTKKYLFWGGAFLLLLCLLLLPKLEEKEPTKPQLASMNFIKCTVAKFLLEDIDSTQQIAPMFTGLGDLNYSISTKNEKSQQFFNQGLRLTYAFNHAEAHRSFMEASRLDKNAAMAYWGQAYALGPNINDPLPDGKRKLKAFEALQKAQKASQGATKKEKALIDALASRNSPDTTIGIESLNMAYMNAMKEVVDQYPNDENIQILYAAAVMNTTPWNYWDKDGNPLPNIPEAKKALEKAIEINPKNPGAHHYYIHMVELPQPDLAVPSADALGKLMPSAGHIVHMPSHIYIRVGRYLDAVESNQKAILADEDYISQCYSQGMYPLGYYPHNIHFLWSASSLLGNSEVAIEAAKKTAEKVPIGELETLPFLQDFASTPLLAYTRFGKWNQILTIPYPGDNFKHLKLIWHYARGIAFLRKDNVKEAKEELVAIEEMKDDPELENLIANYTNPTSNIAKVAYHIIAGEVAAAEGKWDQAVEHIQKGVEFEDQLVYSEPTAWHIPARQTLGNILMKKKQYAKAEQVYKKDLEKLRQNGWSLMGLYKSLEAQGKTDEASKVRAKFEKAWQHADLEIENSIL